MISGSIRVDRLVEPTRSTNMTVIWRRSPAEAAAASMAADGLSRLDRILRRGPSGSPISRRSSSVSSDSVARSISASSNAEAYRSRPCAASQSAMPDMDAISPPGAVGHRLTGKRRQLGVNKDLTEVAVDAVRCELFSDRRCRS